jgi:uncharacterized membrane protein YdjX (TVP38/TMEM64 family)
METEKDTNKIETILFVLFTVAIIAAVALLLPKYMKQIEEFIAVSGVWGPLICIVIYGILGLTVIPSEPLTILAGALFGPLLATLIAGTGNTLAAVVEYMLGGRVNQITNFAEKKAHLPFGLGKLPVDSVSFLILARLIPGYAPKIISLLAGIYKVPLVKYIWTTAIPIFIGAAIFAFGGSGLINIFWVK